MSIKPLKPTDISLSNFGIYLEGEWTDDIKKEKTYKVKIIENNNKFDIGNGISNHAKSLLEIRVTGFAVEYLINKKIFYTSKIKLKPSMFPLRVVFFSYN